MQEVGLAREIVQRRDVSAWNACFAHRGFARIEATLRRPRADGVVEQADVQQSLRRRGESLVRYDLRLADRRGDARKLVVRHAANQQLSISAE